MSVNDNMFKSLQDAGFTGALSDMLYQWLGTFSDNPDQSIGDLWREALLNLSGLPEETYQYNDYYSAYLTSRGYLGSFSDQLDYFWQDIADGVIDLPSGGTPPATGTITPEESISGITVARGFETIDFTIGSLVPDQWLGETVLSCEIQFIDTGGSTIVIPYLRFTTDTIQPDLGDLTLVIDGTDWFAQYDNQSNAYFFTDGVDPKAYSTALWTFFGNNLGTPLSFELKPTEAVSGTLTIGTLIDPQTGGLFQGFANDPDAGATFGSMNPDTYLGETFIFFGVGQIDQGGGNFIYFPSVRFDGNPDKGDLTATIDGTDFFLKYATGINAYGFDDGGDQQAYNGTVYNFLQARSGTTVSFDVTLT